ncbi:uncharacterized protein LOC121258669 [Juglans microcarpa x Juglans regia]|uniref:uncharacterized protein LOC121258669 n=1 Tax=Juglans microcarpa x Juglans regia TaxID=2249226 RepID=UPI001B7EC1DE|nr:uncharacterized protein LOC121258669 [Juglans microcarpa x Juglans regia]
MWCSHDNFLSCVKEAWHRQDSASGLLKLAIRLKRTKLDLRGWNKDVFGRVERNIRALEGRLDFLDNQLQLGYSEEVVTDYLVTKIEIDAWEKREAIRLGQIAKKKWITKGDQNTKFSHSVINQRQKQGYISRMGLSDGRTLDNAEDVRSGGSEYFQEFFTSPTTVEHGGLSALIDKSIFDEDNSMLCLELFEEEVKEAIFSIPKQCSLGPDGFGSGFFMSCLDVIIEDVIEAAREFFRGSPLPKFYPSSLID